MASVKRGVLSAASWLRWERHLRPEGKRRFWKRERKATEYEIASWGLEYERPKPEPECPVCGRPC